MWSFCPDYTSLRAYELAQDVQCGRPSEPLVESRTHCNAQLSSPPLSGAIAYVKSGAQVANNVDWRIVDRPLYCIAPSKLLVREGKKSALIHA